MMGVQSVIVERDAFCTGDTLVLAQVRLRLNGARGTITEQRMDQVVENALLLLTHAERRDVQRDMRVMSSDARSNKRRKVQGELLVEQPAWEGDSVVYRVQLSLREGPNSFSAKTRESLLMYADKLETAQVENLAREFSKRVSTATLQRDRGPPVRPPGLDVELFPYQQRTVNWMTSLENGTSGRVQSMRQLLTQINYVSYGYKLLRIPSRGTAVLDQPAGFLYLLYNPLTGYVLTVDRALEYIASRDGARGLLAEEMGLGKTLEILSLVLLNPGTSPTLIICPESILPQWLDELKQHSAVDVCHYKGFPQPLDAKATIVVCSYSVLAKEVHFAAYDPHRRSLRGNGAATRDLRSPLVQIKFFRIVLDEVQMLGTGASNAARCASMLERTHTWGCSGTPVGSLADLKIVLSYLKMHPFVGTNILQKVNMGELLDWCCDWSIRHTKELVKDEIQIPQQHWWDVPFNLEAVEWDHYQSLWRECTFELGLDSNGKPMDDRWKDNQAMFSMRLRHWINVLKRSCCYPSTNNGRSVGTIEDILSDMITSLEDQIVNLERYNLQASLNKAQFKMEVDHDFNGALDLLFNLQRKTDSLELLHNITFFIATCYYHLGTKLIEDGQESTPDIEETQKLEAQYYKEATEIRHNLLKEPLEQCVKAIACNVKVFELEYADVDLARQQFNTWLKHLHRLCHKPLLEDEVTEKSSAEYDQNAMDQDMIFALLDVLHMMLDPKQAQPDEQLSEVHRDLRSKVTPFIIAPSNIQEIKLTLQHYSTLYNLRATYFKDLQKISDSLLPLEEKPSVYYESKVTLLSQLEGRLSYLHSIRDSTPSSCAICLEDMKSELPSVILKCGHHFHLVCIKSWMATRKACPMCKMKTSMAEVYHITNTSAILDSSSTSTWHLPADYPAITSLDVDKRPSTKTRTVLQLVTYILAPQIIIYTLHTSYIPTLEKYLGRNGISYTTDPHFFKRHTGVRCLILHARYHAAGLTLCHNSYHTILCDPMPRDDPDLKQIQGRVYRIGQRHESHIWSLCAVGTVEESAKEAELLGSLVNNAG